MANATLTQAKRAKNDEFYTQRQDIDSEMSAYRNYDKNVFRGKTILLPCDDPEWSNFTKYFNDYFEFFGIRKLVSTSYNPGARGKLLTKEQGTKSMTITDLTGDGDFRSAEVIALRDEADAIITNPPFSLFREFLAWITEAGKQFSIIGNSNAITYKEVFPLIKSCQMWLGNGFANGNAFFASPDAASYGPGVYQPSNGLVKFRNVSWFTNLDFAKRHEPITFNTMEENIRYNRKIANTNAYVTYDNYDAIEIPSSSAIPSDYDGVMGVPISFLDKLCPEQFKIVGFRHGADGKDLRYTRNNTTCTPYFRVLISHRL